MLWIAAIRPRHTSSLTPVAVGLGGDSRGLGLAAPGCRRSRRRGLSAGPRASVPHREVPERAVLEQRRNKGPPGALHGCCSRIHWPLLLDIGGTTQPLGGARPVQRCAPAPARWRGLPRLRPARRAWLCLRSSTAHPTTIRARSCCLSMAHRAPHPMPSDCGDRVRVRAARRWDAHGLYCRRDSTLNAEVPLHHAALGAVVLVPPARVAHRYIPMLVVCVLRPKYRRAT